MYDNIKSINNSVQTEINCKRKKDHLFISLNKDISYKETQTGFENYKFIHQALPEVDLNNIDLKTKVFGKTLNLPLMISPLVGGVDLTEDINKNLARVAQKLNIAMGVGSQRIALENLNNNNFEKTYRIRKFAPDILLFSNIGAVQLNYGFNFKHCQKAIEMIEADGLILHLNSMQEAFQYEGNHNFENLVDKIKSVCEKLNHPVIVREVGFGISKNTALKLINANVSGIDAGGSGGTSWIEIEKLRAENELLKNVAESFKDWGIPTSESLLMIKEVLDEFKNNKVKQTELNSCSEANSFNIDNLLLIASGGIRDGLDVAKAIALGADIAGIALPILKKINISIQACLDYLKEIEFGLRVAMFGIGAKSIKELKNTRYIKKIN